MTRTVQAFVQNGRGDPIVAQLSASMADMEPVNRLMLAVLERAVSDFRTYATVPPARGRQLFADVDAWFSSSVRGPFDFETICHATGLDPDQGYNDYWCDESNAWIYRHLHVAAERMTELARRHPNADGTTARALNQAARELMLMQASDWPFIMRTGTTVEYATRRINEHVLRFTRLYEELKEARVTEIWLADVEARDNVFPHIDYRIYAS